MLARMWRKGNPSTLLVALYLGAATMENIMEVPQKIELPIPLLPIYLKKMKIVI